MLEYVEGPPLRGHFRRTKRCGWRCRSPAALEEAHRKGILHRDLKPANILVTRKGRPIRRLSVAKLLDFGLREAVSSTPTARGPWTESWWAPPRYMSPEQAQGQPLDARSDIFCFGVVLYEMLSGHRAFSGTFDGDVWPRFCAMSPPLIRRRPALERIVRRCLAEQPEQRFQTMGELRAALEHAPTERLETGPSANRPSPYCRSPT